MARARIKLLGPQQAYAHIFYRASTTIEPIDRSIRRLNNTAYLNHIEWLMILGNFMLLCEIDPGDFYRWFMELFIDSYDCLMLPNVYGMRQHAYGGRITTKPCLSTSNYVSRMSITKRAIGAESGTASTGGSSTSTVSF